MIYTHLNKTTEVYTNRVITYYIYHFIDTNINTPLLRAYINAQI